MRTRPGDATSHAGGLVVGHHRRSEQKGLERAHEVIVVGRAVSVNIDPPLDGSRKPDAFRRIAAAGTRTRLPSASLGTVENSCIATMGACAPTDPSDATLT